MCNSVLLDTSAKSLVRYVLQQNGKGKTLPTTTVEIKALKEGNQAFSGMESSLSEQQKNTIITPTALVSPVAFSHPQFEWWQR